MEIQRVGRNIAMRASASPVQDSLPDRFARPCNRTESRPAGFLNCLHSCRGASRYCIGNQTQNRTSNAQVFLFTRSRITWPLKINSGHCHTTGTKRQTWTSCVATPRVPFTSGTQRWSKGRTTPDHMRGHSATAEKESASHTMRLLLAAQIVTRASEDTAGTVVENDSDDTKHKPNP